jgi:hypothetical protein
MYEWTGSGRRGLSRTGSPVVSVGRKIATHASAKLLIDERYPTGAAILTEKILGYLRLLPSVSNPNKPIRWY